MSTPYPSFDNGHETHSLAEQTLGANLDEGETLMEDSQVSSRGQHNHCHQERPLAPTMSPRIPRKRIVASNSGFISKEDDYGNDFELQPGDKTPLTNVSPSVVIASNSPAMHGYSGHDLGSHPSSSAGGSYRKPIWALQIERDDDGPHAQLTKDDEAQHDLDSNCKKTPKKGIDVSLYTTKKNVAQGMLDIALLSANCSQLKYLLFHYERDSTSLTVGNEATSSGGSAMVGASVDSSWFGSMDFYFIVNLVCIGFSITLQVLVGILLILNGRHNVYVHRYQRVADSYSNLILVTVFIITIVNIFLSVFISAR